MKATLPVIGLCIATLVTAFALTAYQLWKLNARITHLETANQALHEQLTTKRVVVADSRSQPRVIVQVNQQDDNEAQIVLLAPNGRELVDILSRGTSGAEMVFNSDQKYGNVQIGRLVQGDVVSDPSGILWGVKVNLRSGVTTTFGVTESGDTVQPMPSGYRR